MKIDRGDITFNIYDLLDRMSDDQKKELAYDICWDKTILNDFVHQLMTGYASEHVDVFIHEARLKFIDMMPEAAAEVIRSLNAEVQRSKAEAEYYREEQYRIWQSYPREVSCQEKGCSGRYKFRLPDKNPYPVTLVPSSEKIMIACGYKPVEVQEELVV